MEDKNCELLFEYLRSILYDKEIQTLDITKLDEPYQKLGWDFRYWNGLLRRCWNIPKTFLWEIGKNTEKPEGSSKEDFTMSFSYGVVEYDSREEGINRRRS